MENMIVLWLCLPKRVFGNWIEKKMCRNYRLLNHKTKSNHYPMPMLEEIFDAMGFFEFLVLWT